MNNENNYFSPPHIPFEWLIKLDKAFPNSFIKGEAFHSLLQRLKSIDFNMNSKEFELFLKNFQTKF
jgi:hypothetical protein